MKSRITSIEDVKNLANNFQNTATQASISSKQVFEELAQQFENINPNLGGFEEFSSILAMPDEEFVLLSPIFAQELERGLNNPSDRLMLIETLNASGNKIEDLKEQYDELIKQIDNVGNVLSVPKRDFLKRIIGSVYNAMSETEGIAKRFIRIPIELCNENAKVPTYARAGDAGLDLYALEDITIEPGETKIIPTGLKVAIPLGYELQVRPKSGRCAKSKLRVANTPGTIDSGYRDEIGVILENIEPKIKDITYSQDEAGEIHITSILHGSSYTIGKGEKFAQLVLSEVPTAGFYTVESINNYEGNRGGGFGSTGLA